MLIAIKLTMFDIIQRQTPTPEALEMSKKVKVSKIKIELGNNQTIELTMEQARELQEVLNDTLGKRETVVLPAAPVIIEPWYPPYRYPYWSVTIGDTCTHPSDGTGQITSGTAVYSLNAKAIEG